jgi:hypothetical protein
MWAEGSHCRRWRGIIPQSIKEAPETPAAGTWNCAAPTGPAVHLRWRRVRWLTLWDWGRGASVNMATLSRQASLSTRQMMLVKSANNMMIVTGTPRSHRIPALAMFNSSLLLS